MKKGNLVLFEQVNHTLVVLLDDGVFTALHFGDIKAQALHFNTVLGKVMVCVVVML